MTLVTELTPPAASAPPFSDHPDHVIAAVTATIVDLPLRRPHFHATGTHATQSLVMVELVTSGGAVGWGEGGTPGGTAFWGGECVETIKLMIDHYLAPAVIGISVFDQERILAAMDRIAANNHFAKAAIDIAVHDAAARLIGISVSQMFGGTARSTVPVLWALAAAAYEADVADAIEQIEAGRHSVFKIKIGKGDAASETRRALETATTIHDAHPDARFVVDLNQAWDESTAMRWLAAFQERDFLFVEQPVPAWNVEGMIRLASRFEIPIMADEGLWDFHDAYELIRRGATDIYAVKIAKGGGLRRAFKAAAVAEAAGVPLYGGMALESSVGTAAGLQLFSALPNLPFGCELIGPRLLAEDLTVQPIAYRDREVVVPSGVGMGVEIDRDRVRSFTRRNK
ncbi:TfdD [Sphingobium herbicidovorans NBRC 16415]|uniref:TfdD n=2 Tax=Sphingomonadaceae TaxID=41297 RepID=A0A086P5X3_SPHHM|nr:MULTISPECIES: muconate cycloisomerase family protein [Sphingomonadaceae]AAT99367.1 TfdD [Sphingomonas sp. TFD44]KFG88791.1 TfdD [Sphingobium herbicidovorans NBRC 16415]